MSRGVNHCPSLGEWDVNNPASADGFTIIFNKARDEKKTGGISGATETPTRNNVGGLQPDETYQYPTKSLVMTDNINDSKL
ncbi:hypothetical protein C4D60_Mb01t17800 [Musa balbisiana]|uniref:RIN4 pathogenic type III effector avirulence factor Avr cleavage site domain-containing protein n=1 Tax=Musa balbisiana TaxID=52838 RepID=A0A4V4H7F4_MUSBA|nr:hypothetical protein C4D60_Mb01t17800 [Musa balbisiana]